MKLLLDTHVVLWMLYEPERLALNIQAAVSEPSNTLLVSAATLWESAIKAAQGRLTAPDDFPADLVRLGCTLLPVTAEHGWALRLLPRLHGDPFDRMLVVQALAEDAILVTHDRTVQAYGCKVWLT